MAALAVVILGTVAGAYWWKSSEHPPPATPTDEEREAHMEAKGFVDSSASRPLIVPGHGTLAAAVTSDPGKYTPISDVDRSLYEAQMKHLNISSRFVHG